MGIHNPALISVGTHMWVIHYVIHFSTFTGEGQEMWQNVKHVYQAVNLSLRVFVKLARIPDFMEKFINFNVVHV